MSEVFTGEWYPWYPEKALTSEAIDHLTLAEEAAFRRALDKAWIKGSVPNNPKELARVIGKGCSVKIAARVLELFTPVEGNPARAINRPQEKIRNEQRVRHSKSVERATKAAEKRWSKEANKNGHSDATSIAQADATSIPQAVLKDAYIDIDIDIDIEKKNSVCVSHAVSEDVARKTDTILDALRSHYKLHVLRDETGWIDAIDFALVNGFSDTQFLECHDLLTKQKWRKGRITPKNVADNLPDLPKLRDEIRDQNNGTNRQFSNGSKPTPASIIANRPYRQLG